MQDRLVAATQRLKTPLAEYVPAKWNGKNTAGYRPVGDYVLVLPDNAPGESLGGIMFTETQQDRDGKAAETGVLVAIGDGAWAWNSDRSRPFTGTKPEVGQRVWFARYAGSQQYGADKVMYLLMLDKCIGAVAE
jgi:co-chaperonin GroES (HSP10)